MTNPQQVDTDNDGVPDGIDPYPLDANKTTSEQPAQYAYNHLGQRISKTVAGVTTHFVYSHEDGQLLGEYNAAGNPLRIYVYLEGERVAMLDYTTGTMQKIYLANNHIGQVQYAWDEWGNPRYARQQAPFGEGMIADAGNLDIPVRFPGQYADSETGFNQNWNRDYDPAVGRYVQSDPIGITKDYEHNPEFYVMQRLGLSMRPSKYGSGLNNMYGYVDQIPSVGIDPYGLEQDNQEPKTHGAECKDGIGFNCEKSSEVKPENPSPFVPDSCYITKDTAVFCCYSRSAINNEYRWSCGRPPRTDERDGPIRSDSETAFLSGGTAGLVEVVPGCAPCGQQPRAVLSTSA